MTQQERQRTSLEHEAERARDDLAATLDALGAKTQNIEQRVKHSAASAAEIVGGVAATALLARPLARWLGKRRRARAERVTVIRAVVASPFVLLATAAALFIARGPRAS